MSVRQVGNEWVASCGHGGSMWAVHRGSEYNARRSLRAHVSAEHPLLDARPDLSDMDAIGAWLANAEVMGA